jgi:hypothetical protein
MSLRSIIKTDYPLTKKIHRTEYAKKVKINGTLPFRVKFLPGIIQEYAPGNGAPIGIAIIGVNNYIL